MAGLDKWDRLPHAPGSWQVIQEVVGPFQELVSEDQLIPIPADINWHINCNEQPDDSQGFWQAITSTQWPSLPGQSGWEESYYQQMAYYAEYEAYAAAAAAAAAGMPGLGNIQAENMHDNGGTTQQQWALQAYAAQATCGSSVFPPQCPLPFSAGYANSGHQPCPEAQLGLAQAVTMIERASSSIAAAFPKGDVLKGMEPSVAEQLDILENASPGGRRQPGQAGAALQASRYGHDQLVTTASGTGLQTNTHHGSYTAAGSAAATAMDPGYYYSWVDAEQQMASLSQLQTGALPVSSGSPLAAARKPGRTTPGGCTRKKATKKTPKRPAAGG